MDIIVFTKVFQELEIEHGFFEFENDDGIKYWDIVRHDVFYAIYYEITGMDLPLIEEKKHSTILNYWCKITSSFKVILNFIKKTQCKYKYIFFTASRNIYQDKSYFDQISNDIIDLKGSNSLIIETYNDSRLKPNIYNAYLNLLLNLKFKIFNITNFSEKNNSVQYKVSKILNNFFNTSVDTDRVINRLIRRFIFEKRYYMSLFKKVECKAVVFVQNGVQKAMIMAARESNVVSYELQHGYVGYVHPAYSYPKGLEEIVYSLPDYFLTFSFLWSSNFTRPTTTCVTLFNNFYAATGYNPNKLFDLTFILANIYSCDLLPFLDSLLKIRADYNICIKLHPNQIIEQKQIVARYINYPKVMVVGLEETMSEILSQSHTILGIQSTAVYEALHHNVKVILLQRKDYNTHQDILNNDNVYVVNEAADIIPVLAKPFVPNKDSVIFSPFNQAAVQGIIAD